ncbi:META domain-containing protein [Streptomyces sp. NBC_00878]|uniref:META domain-containing protein n=1 Tax=Streptomyces sp. NBC_00878 TaxID=2975854 RepID=UPI002257D965|nr:META domain-containing protein [Streptomyces sp. NBC_00878]MCX4906927.1 META domain-containing protein [Streptomyces sp. NBC_00878]
MHTQRLNLSALGAVSTRVGLSALTVTGLLATAACGTESGSGTSDSRSGSGSGAGSVSTRTATEIIGKQWNVQSVTVDGKTRLAPAGAHIEFGKDGKMGGNYGCNHFAATAEIKGDTITIGNNTVKTEMACTTKGTMDFESQLGGVISSSTAKAELNDDKLTLTMENGTTVDLTAEKPAEPAELYGTKWNVTGMTKDAAKGDSAVALVSEAEGQVHLTFDEKGTVSGKLGCNKVTAKATVGDGTITLGTPGTTRMMCSPSLMDTEKTLLKLFGGTVKYQLKGSTLTLTSENGTGVEAVAAK